MASDEVEIISELLFAAEALSVTCSDHQDDAIFEPQAGTPLWKETEVMGLFEVTCDMDTVLKNSNVPAPR